MQTPPAHPAATTGLAWLPNDMVRERLAEGLLVTTLDE